MYVFLKKTVALWLCVLGLWCTGGLLAAAVEPPRVFEDFPPATHAPVGSEEGAGPEIGAESEGPPIPEGVTQPDEGAETEEGAGPEIGAESEGPPIPEGVTQPDEGAETEEPEAEPYTVTLGSRIIGEGECLNYTTISPAFAGGGLMDGYYPGELTIQLTGTVVVEAGGSLSIGTLSIGGPEASPVVTGTGQIIVKAGGSLRLTASVLEPQGDAPLIVQESGGSVEVQCMTVEEGIIQWSAPLVNNLYDSPDDLWLEVGTSLTEAQLPAVLNTALQKEGREEHVDVSLSWDLSKYDGRTQGEFVLSGEFLDENGQPLLSLLPLEMTVRWYTPGTLVVTEAKWKGSTVPTVQMTVQELPEDADVWGDVSTDGGATWSRWESEDVFFIVEIESEGWGCIFNLSDETPGLFRIVAETPSWFDGYACWRSTAFALGPPEDGKDSGGNRGGSTTPDPPEREPEPAERPDTGTEDDAHGQSAPSQAESPVQDVAQAEEGEISAEGEAPEIGPEAPEVLPPETGESHAGTSGKTDAAEKTDGTGSEITPLTGPETGAEEELTWKAPAPVPAASLGQQAEVDAAAESPEGSASEPEEEPHPEELAQGEPSPVEPDAGRVEGPLSVPAQLLLVAAGVGACAVGGMAAARLGPFRKKRS